MQSPSDTVIATPRSVRVLPSLDDLLGELGPREAFLTSDSKSGSRFERVTYGGERMVLKHVSIDDDWIMRGTGDLDSRTLRFFSSVLPERIPDSIDPTVVAVAPNRSRHGHRGAVLLLRDVSTLLVPPGDTQIGFDQHRRFIDHMAELHAAFWNWTDDMALMPVAHHYMFLTPAMADLEAARSSVEPVPAAVAQGWRALDNAAPAVAPTLRDLARDPGPLVAALAATPQTLNHGDWKLGNLGEHPDGRTVLLDWDRVGAAPATYDLAWYVAINSSRLPEGKEATIAAYRSSLESHGVDTASWWNRQVALTLLGAAVQFCWEKVGDPEEFGWWQDRIAEGMRHLT
jgi:Phosphotransferase enzyme family